jgi:hypothetical protein
MIPSIPTPPTKLPRVQHSPRSEHGEQAALFQWIELQIPQFPEYALIAAIPNGGYRPGAWKKIMQDEGQRPGLADVIWPMPRVCDGQEYAGMFMENKTDNGKLSASQKLWRAAIVFTPMLYQLAHGFDEMVEIIQSYHALAWPATMKDNDITLFRFACAQYWDEVVKTRETRKLRRRMKNTRAW